MRVVVFGTGGVGGYFGARLAEAGEEVVFVARGEHLEAIRAGGLHLRSISGDLHLPSVVATDKVDESFRPDLVLVCVKAWQIHDAANAIRPLLGDQTVVMPLLNGVEAPEQLGAVLGRERIVAGLCGIIAYIEEPGVVRHAAVEKPFVKFGEPDNQRTNRVNALEALFSKARGIDAEIPEDIDSALWMKFLFIATTSGVGAVTRAPMGVFRKELEPRRLLERALQEVYDVAIALGVGLREDAITKTLAMIDGLPEAGTSSMQRDLMAGRPSELEAQTGAVVRLGKSAGVDTPINEFIYASFISSERRARGELDYDI